MEGVAGSRYPTTFISSWIDDLSFDLFHSSVSDLARRAVKLFVEVRDKLNPSNFALS